MFSRAPILTLHAISNKKACLGSEAELAVGAAARAGGGGAPPVRCRGHPALPARRRRAPAAALPKRCSRALMKC